MKMSFPLNCKGTVYCAHPLNQKPNSLFNHNRSIYPESGFGKLMDNLKGIKKLIRHISGRDAACHISTFPRSFNVHNAGGMDISCFKEFAINFLSRKSDFRTDPSVLRVLE
jgi:hypothetical protein